jgi:hypothetical protein
MDLGTTRMTTLGHPDARPSLTAAIIALLLNQTGFRAAQPVPNRCTKARLGKPCTMTQ